MPQNHPMLVRSHLFHDARHWWKDLAQYSAHASSLRYPLLKCLQYPQNAMTILAFLSFVWGQSRRAPHRVTTTRECTVRRRDRCEKMTMWEIQDMTLNVSRGMEHFEKRLSARSVRFQNEFNRLESLDSVFGLRFTALPVGEDVQLDRMYHQGGLIEGIKSPWSKVTLKDRRGTRTLDHAMRELPPHYWRPILRGARAESDPVEYRAYKPKVHRISGGSLRWIDRDGLCVMSTVFPMGFTLGYVW